MRVSSGPWWRGPGLVGRVAGLWAAGLAATLSAPASAVPGLESPLGTARADVPEPAGDTYDTAVRLVRRLFLEPEAIDEVSLLRAAARGLVHDVPWLQARADGRAVDLYHGEGTPLGRVEVASLDDLPRALGRLERVVEAGGYDIGGVDVKVSVLSGMVSALDRHSRVLTDERLERFNERLYGTRVGIGASFEWAGADLRITAVSPAGPAAEGGVRPDDVVVRIDGRSTLNMPTAEAVRRVGGEVGTQVVLTVRRAGQLFDVALTRAEVVVPNVDQRLLAGGVGYVRIDHVSQQTVENLRGALAELRARGGLQRGLVLDLRGNAGGSLRESAQVADLFLEHGLLFRTVGRGGVPVQNLQPEMSAQPDDDDLRLPIVVVVDERTASGSEILAGALLELDRAALVGARTYGKGTVQRFFDLEPDVRLKLTVAQYLLANGRSIAEVGIVPDVVVGRVSVDSDDVRFVGFDEDRQRVPWSRIVPEVRTGQGDADLPVELARRAILRAASSPGPSTRAAILDGLAREASAVQVEQAERLRAALVDRGLDWSPADVDGENIAAEVTVTTSRGPGDRWTVEAAVDSREAVPLHQVLVELACAGAPFWDGVVVPIGLVAAGSGAVGRTTVTLPPGVDLRQDTVEVRLRADRRPVTFAGEAVLSASSTPTPGLQVRARLVPAPDERGPHGHPVLRAEIVLHNPSRTALAGVEARFGFPGTDAVELLDHGARLAELGAQRDATLSLAVEVAPGAPLELPLALEIDAERFGRVLDWPVTLPTGGGEVVLEAPRIEAGNAARAAPVGPFTLPLVVTDDRRVDHVVVWLNGEKAGWSGGGAERVELAPTLALSAGDNRVTVQTEDDQHLRTTRTFNLRGVSTSVQPEVVDAGPDAEAPARVP